MSDTIDVAAELRKRMQIPEATPEYEQRLSAVLAGRLPEEAMIDARYQDFIDKSSDPAAAIAQLNCTKFFSDSFGIPFDEAAANYSRISKEWFGQAASPITTWESIQNDYQAGLYNWEVGNIWARKRDGTATPEDDKRLAELEADPPAVDKLTRSLPVQALKWAAQSVPYTAAGMLGVAAGGAVGMGLSALAEIAFPEASLAIASIRILGKALPSLTKIGATAGSMAATYGSQGGLEYRDMLKAGVNPEIAKWGSRISDLLQQAIESDEIMGLLPGKAARGSLVDAAQNVIGEGLMKGTWRNPIMKFALRQGTRTLVEGGQEALQQGITEAAYAICAKASESAGGQDVPRHTWGYIADQIVQNFVGGALASIPLGALGEPLAIHQDIQEYKRYRGEKTLASAQKQQNPLESAPAQPTSAGEAPEIILTPPKSPLQFQSVEEDGTQQLRGTTQEAPVIDGQKTPTVWANYTVDEEAKIVKVSTVQVANSLIEANKTEARAQVGQAVQELRKQYDGYEIQWNPKGQGSAWIKNEITRQNPNFFAADYKQTITASKLEAQIQSVFKPESRAESKVFMDLLAGNERRQSALEGRDFDLDHFVAATFTNEGIQGDLSGLSPQAKEAISAEEASGMFVKGATLFVDTRDGSIIKPEDVKAIREHVRAAVYLTSRADAGTVLHELTHVLEAMGSLSSTERDALEKHYGKKYEDFGRKEREDLAYSAVNYAKYGNAPEGLKGILSRLLEMLHTVVVASESENAKLSPELKAFYREFFTRGEAGKEAIAEVQATQGEVKKANAGAKRTTSPSLRATKEGQEEPQKAEPIVEKQAEIAPQPQGEAIQGKPVQVVGDKEGFHNEPNFPIAEIGHHPGLPNYKEGANKKGVIEPIPGKPDKTGMGPVLLWQDKAGKSYIVTGRHRLDLFLRNGETTIPAHVFKESEGHSIQEMAIRDAEMNIKDGQGSTKDHALFFRQAGYTRADADERGLLRGDKAKIGFAIGAYSTEPLYVAFRNSQIGETRAAAIGESAPNDERLQTLGLKLVQSNPKISPEVLFNTLRLAAQETQGVKTSQGDMFGMDDSAVVEGLAMGEAAESIRSELNNEQRTLSQALKLGSGQKAEILERFGFKSGDEQAIGDRILALQTEAQSWENWTQDPAKRREARIRAGLTVKDEAPEAISGEEAISKDSEDTETPPLFERDVANVSYRFPEELKGYPDIHSQAQVRGVNVFGRGAIDSFGRLRLGDAGSSHTDLTNSMQDAKRFYFGKVILSNIFDKYRLQVKPGKKLQFSETDAKANKTLESPLLFEEDTATPEFKAWFDGSKVADQDGNPKIMYSGHGNIALYGPKYDSRKGTAGGFYSTDSPEVASGYATSKWGSREYYERGSEYRITGKNGQYNKKLWQVPFTDAMKAKLDELIQEEDQNQEQKYPIAEMPHYIENYKNYDKQVRRWTYNGGIYNLQNIFDFYEMMGYTIFQSLESNATDDERLSQTNDFEVLMTALGLKWLSYRQPRPGVMRVYLAIKNPIDTSKPFPGDLLAALDEKSKRERKMNEEYWTRNYSMKQWVQDIKNDDGVHGWATQIPQKAMPILKSFGYDGILDRGWKGKGPNVENAPMVAIAFDSGQIKSISNKRPTSDPRFMFEHDPWIYKSEETINQKMQGPMPGANILKMLQADGVKADELHWMGLDDYLATDKKLSLQEVKDYIAANKLNIVEVTYGSQYDRQKKEWKNAEIAFRAIVSRRGYNESEINNAIRKLYNAQTDPNNYDDEEIKQAGRRLVDSRIAFFNDLADTPQTVFEAYSLPGGENYREVMITLPREWSTSDKEKIESAAVVVDGKTYTGPSHSEAMLKAQEAGVITRKGSRYYDSEGDELPAGWNDYFVTTEGRLLNRFQSYNLFDVPASEYIEQQQRTMPRKFVSDEARIKYGELSNQAEKLNQEIDSRHLRHDGPTYEELAAKRDAIEEEMETLTEPDYERLPPTPFANRAQKGGNYEVPQAHRYYDNKSDQNRLAHARLKDRTVAEGRRMLFVEEIQSDWHQKARGIRDNRINALANERGIKRDSPEWTALQKEVPADFGYAGNSLPQGIEIKTYDLNGITLYFAEKNGVRLTGGMPTRQKVIDEMIGTEFVPPAPFSKTWHEFVFKRLLREAVDNGYESIGWTTGKQQAERYDLSKQVQHIAYETNDDGTYNISAPLPDGSPGIYKEDLTFNEVRSLVGKDIAELILSGEGRDKTREEGASSYRDWKILEGKDLTVGGKGMGGFYDKMLVDYANKIGKKWNASVEDALIGGGNDRFQIVTAGTGVNDGTIIASGFRSEIEAEDYINENGFTYYEIKPMEMTVHSLPITQEMRDSITNEGLPLFELEAPRKEIALQEQRARQLEEQLKAEETQGGFLDESGAQAVQGQYRATISALRAARMDVVTIENTTNPDVYATLAPSTGNQPWAITFHDNHGNVAPFHYDTRAEAIYDFMTHTAPHYEGATNWRVQEPEFSLTSEMASPKTKVQEDQNQLALFEHDDLAQEAAQFDNLEDFIKTYGEEDRENLTRAWKVAHAENVTSIERANQSFLKKLSKGDTLDAFLENEGIRLIDAGKESGNDLVEAAAIRLARGLPMTETKRQVLTRAIERSPNKWRERFAAFTQDKKMIEQIQVEKAGKAPLEYNISEPEEDLDLTAKEARLRAAIKELDPNMQKEFEQQQISYEDAMNAETAVHQETEALQADLKTKEATLADYRARFSPEEKRIAQMTQDAQQLERELKVKKLQKKAGVYQGAPMEELQAQIDDKRAAIRDRINKLSPQSVTRDENYQATKKAVADTRSHLKEIAKKARAKKAEKDMMIAIAKSIVRPPSRVIDWKIAQQIREIQKAIDPNFRKNLAEWPVEALRKLFQEGPGLGKILPAEVVDRLNKRPLNLWTMEELRDLEKRVDALRELGASIYAARLAERDLGNYDVQRAVRRTLLDSGKMKDQPPYESKEFREQMKKDNSVFTRFDLSLSRMMDVALRLDNGTKGAFYQSLVEGERKAFTGEKEVFDKRWNGIEQRMKELKLSPEQLYKESIKVGDFAFSRWEVLGMYIGLQNVDTKNAIIYGNMMNQDQRENLGEMDFDVLASKNLSAIKTAVQELTIPEKELAAAFIKDGTENIERLREAVYQYENRMPAAVDVYFPHERRMRTGEGALQEQQAEDLLNRSSRLPRGVGKQPTIERIKIGARHQSPIVLDALGVYRRGMERQEHYINYAGWVQDMNSIYMDPRKATSVRYGIKQTYGQGYLDYIDRWIKESANPRAFDEPLNPLAGMDRVFHTLRGPLGVAYLGFRTSNVIKQVLTSPMSYLPYGPGFVTRRLLMHLNPAELMRSIRFVEDNSPMMRHRQSGRGMEEVRRYAESPKANAALKKAAAVSMYLLEWSDKITIAAGWMGIYEKTLAELKDSNLSADEIKAKAIAEADDVTTRVQPTSRSADLSPMFKSESQVIRFLTQFKTPMNVIYNQLFHDVPTDFTHGHAGRALGIMAGYIAAGAVFSLLAAPRSDDDDALKKLKTVLAGTLRQPFDVLPLGGEMVGDVVQRLVTGRGGYRGSGDMFPGLDRMLSGLTGALTADTKEKAFHNFLTFMEGTGMLTGIPTSAIKEYYRAIFEQDLGALVGRPKK